MRPRLYEARCPAYSTWGTPHTASAILPLVVPCRLFSEKKFMENTKPFKLVVPCLFNIWVCRPRCAPRLYEAGRLAYSTRGTPHAASALLTRCLVDCFLRKLMENKKLPNGFWLSCKIIRSAALFVVTKSDKHPLHST